MINIIIKKIEMLNFGPYYGNHELSFLNDGIGIHLIRGGTGQGKTSIQRAILWALYGVVSDRKGEKIRLTSLLNHTAKKKDMYKYAVQISFIHEGENWIIARATMANRHIDHKYEEGMKIEVYKNGKIVPDPEHEIQRILPSSISRFYFFDGEMLRDYEELLEEDSMAMALLKDSIESVLGLPYFKTARSDLDSVKKKFERERGRILRQLGGADWEQLAEFQQILEGDLEELERSLDEIEYQKRKLDAEIAADKRKLADMKEVRDLANQRIAIEEGIKNREDKKGRKTDERSVLVEKLYKNVLAPIATNLIQQLEIKSKQSLEKYNQKQQAIERARILKEGISKSKCSYCGTILDPKKLAEFERELEETKIKIDQLTQIPEPDLSFEISKTALENMTNSLTSPNELKEKDEQIIEIEYEIQRLRSELEQVKSKLEGVDAEEPKKLEIKIRQSEFESGRLKGIIEEKEKEKLKLLENKSELDRQIAAIPQGQLQKLNKKIEFIEKVRNIFEKSVSSFREEQKDRVENTATEIFRQIRSKEDFDRLEINNRYGLSIITKQKTVLNRSEWRSSGEEQLVALSLIGALNNCAQVEAPIFMDTPFGRFDVEHGERVLKYLPKMSKQLVLLVTDREFREGDEVHLSGNIKTDLTLRYKGEEEGSIILPTIAGGQV
ncbi:MAG: AAA family ATPase [Methanomicrobia archaeon]|nr:AAA family ATPase [Methanomicrobia archaeon]